MAKLEDLRSGVTVAGIVPNQSVTIVDTKWHGSIAVELVFKYDNGQPGTQLIFRADEARLELVQAGHRWGSGGDGNLFRLSAEAYRIHLAHLFDPVLAVHTSLVEPLPHQITAVYGEMLTRQPLRYLLADDPGAGKTIMAGLFIKELVVRGDLRRCLICVPGSLAAQWQDEMWIKFQLHFEILTRETIEASVSGNPFLEKHLVIVRLDQMARSADLQEKLQRTDWDLIICDEAHKMSASFFGNELRRTRRYVLGQLLGNITRHFLLMTATPHNGKEEDFQLFLGLLDADRFEGKFRDGVHQVDVSDMMRRMIKEKLLKFDGRPLFPERRAYTVNYTLSAEEMRLYSAVTEYVREEFNRVDQEDDSRKGTVGFALTVLQRRLASSPEAIYQSLDRRRKRLEKRLEEEEARRITQAIDPDSMLAFSDDYLDDIEDAPADEREELEEHVIDSATAARTVAELKIEIEVLKRLAQMAFELRHSGRDRKWEEIASIIQDDDRMISPTGQRRKLVLFTEHRDTLRYLWGRISTLFGRDDMLVRIDGGMSREQRRDVEDRFRNDPEVLFLLATDAAGEGINLQRAHLMINYDLPWNPNRLEQRFGRIHRIGQTEVCHLWNLVAGETREGHVYERLLRKLEAEGKALDGQVFDVLGKLFEQAPLRNLLIEAVRYGDHPDVRARLEQTVDNVMDREHVRELLERRSLVQNTLDISQIMRIREELERYAARRLQPHYIQAFFIQAFEMLGGTVKEREAGRFQITHVPALIRQHAEALDTPYPVQRQYERVCFDKNLISQAGKPLAAFVCPGHPLLDALIALMLERHRDSLRFSSVLIDPTDAGTSPRALFFLEQSIQDARQMQSGDRRVISREVHFVEIDADESIHAGGSAPYLDYRAATEDELQRIDSMLSTDWLNTEGLENRVIGYAVEELIPRHLERERSRREELIDKTLRAVQERLTKEINYWDKRAAELRRAEQAGKPNAKLNSAKAQQRADELHERLERRKQELALERQISAMPPVIVGGALIVPAGLLSDHPPREAADTRIVEAIAMQAVMAAEAALGNQPRDVSMHKLGFDIESLDPRTGRLRFIEVKGRRAGALTVTITKNEILTALNMSEQFILAIVEVQDGEALPPRYVMQPFRKEPDFGVTSINYDLRDFLAVSFAPK